MANSTAKDAYYYITDQKTIVVVIVLILIFAAFMAIPILDPSVLDSLMGEMAKSQTQEIDSILNYSLFILPAIIYLRNLSVALILVLTSITVVIPLFIIALNGMIVSAIIMGMLDSLLTANVLANVTPGGLSVFIVSSLAPHGMIEIPTITISASTIAILPRGLGRLAKSAKGVLYIASANLLAAAIIESTITLILALFVAALFLFPIG